MKKMMHEPKMKAREHMAEGMMMHGMMGTMKKNMMMAMKHMHQAMMACKKYKK